MTKTYIKYNILTFNFDKYILYLVYLTSTLYLEKIYGKNI